jgi:hypothetical protein
MNFIVTGASLAQKALAMSLRRGLVTRHEFGGG